MTPITPSASQEARIPRPCSCSCLSEIMMPFFLFALYERNGLPLEKYLLYFVRACFIRPKQRPYMTNNFYAALEKQDELDREVHRIVHRKT